MAPESGVVLSPGIDQATSDFELSGQLYSAVLYRENGVCRDAVAALFRCAMKSPQAHFSVDGDADAPPPWAALFGEASRSGTLLRRHDEEMHWLAIPLVFGEEALGLIGVGADSYDDAAIHRFADLASLLAGLLHSRRAYDLRVVALAGSEAEVRRQSQLLAQIRDSLITMDTDGYITGWNGGAERLFGYAAGEIIGQHILILYSDEDADDQGFNLCLENGSHEMSVRRRKKSGELFWASVALSLVRDEQGNPCALIGYIVDISAQHAAEEALRLHARIFEQNSEAIVITDAERRIVSVNQAFSRLTGFSAAEVLGNSALRLGAPDSGSDFFEHQGLRGICRRIAGGKVWRGELGIRCRDGSSFPAQVSISEVDDDSGGLCIADPAARHGCIVFSDISEHKAAEREIKRLACFDAITGLPNRSSLFSLLRQVLAEAVRGRTHAGVLLLNLDRFKNINDSFGHSAADLLLNEVGSRLAAALRDEDIVARLGGDEFMILLPKIMRREHAGHVAQKLLAAIAEPFLLNGIEVLLSAGVGISIFPDDGDDGETLLKHADVAMYRAKHAGSGMHVFYSKEMNQRSLEQLKLESDLRRAVERGEFSLHFQPQLSLTHARIHTAEALLRWHRPGSGAVPPAQFIPIAEETGLIVRIGGWVLDAACRQIAQWRAAGLPPLRVAVNLSARQFTAALPQTILETLARHSVPADALEIEITESVLMTNAEAVVATMRELGEAGIRLSLDDFGTGFSSLSYLKRLPIDSLKIDQSFIRGIPDDASDVAIALSIIGMAKNLRLSVIAEGVETREQYDFLKAAGCDQIQGYYFSRPLPADDFPQLLAEAGQ